MEGSQSIYTVLMDGPPVNEVTLDLQTTVDGYIRLIQLLHRQRGRGSNLHNHLVYIQTLVYNKHATTCDFSFHRTLNDRLTFNLSNWNETREIIIVGVDDDIIRCSPYGGILNVTSRSNDSSLNAAGELTILVADTDECELVCII